MLLLPPIGVRAYPARKLRARAALRRATRNARVEVRSPRHATGRPRPSSRSASAATVVSPGTMTRAIASGSSPGPAEGVLDRAGGAEPGAIDERPDLAPWNPNG